MGVLDSLFGGGSCKQAALGQDWLEFARDGFVVTPARQAKIDACERQIRNFVLSASKSDRERYPDTFRELDEEYLFGAADRLPRA